VNWYTGVAPFASRWEHRLSLQALHGFPQSLQINTGTVLRLGHNFFYPNLFHFNSHRTIRRHRVWKLRRRITHESRGNHDWCVSGLRPSPGILKNTTFRELGLFPSSGKEWETPTLLGPLERANPNNRILITEIDPVNVVFFYIL
jgi:hypothetical protein